MKIASSGLRLFSLNDTHVIETKKKRKTGKNKKMLQREPNSSYKPPWNLC